MGINYIQLKEKLLLTLYSVINKMKEVMYMKKRFSNLYTCIDFYFNVKKNGHLKIH